MKLNTEKITARLKEMRWNVSDLAREIGVNPQSIYPKLRGHNSPTLSTIDKIAAALKIDNGKDLIE
uniref:Putative DNA binding, helix-turn-helix domain containing protein n=1 Tax=viral metagenome TaxID=1070528 RepID=A0A6M3LBN5_9ZZZZ